MTELLVGTDYRFTLPRGLANRQLERNDGGPELYGYDPYQFYLQAFLPDLGPRGTKVIAGRFATHVGYEVVQAVDTPFVPPAATCSSTTRSPTPGCGPPAS